MREPYCLPLSSARLNAFQDTAHQSPERARLRTHEDTRRKPLYPNPDFIRLRPFCLTLSTRLSPAFCLHSEGSHNEAVVSPSLISPLGNNCSKGRGVKETKNPQGSVILQWSRHVFSSSVLIYHSAPASRRLIAFHTFPVCKQPGTFPAASSTFPNTSSVCRH